MSTPVNCGTTFCSCIECVTSKGEHMMTREELEKAVDTAEAARTAAGDIYAAALAALKAYDKENT